MALAGALAVAAVTAMVAVATGDFSDGDLRVLGASIGFAVFSSVAATGTDLLPRAGRGLRGLGLATAGTAALAFVLLVRALWVGQDDDGAWQLFGYAALLSLALSHACVVLGARRREDTALVGALGAASIGLAAVNTGLGMAGIAGALDDVGEGGARVVALLVIAWLLTSLLPPVLRRVRVEAPRPAGAPVAPVEIKVRHNGPYKVTGPIRLIDADGNEYDVPVGEGVALCRCGASQTKPFCDKTHSKVGFDAAERAVRERG